jgi:hypothetical protein
MKIQTAAGAALLSAGASLLIIGIDAAHPLAGRESAFLSCHPGPALCVAAGVAIAFSGLELELLKLARKRVPEPL